MKINANPHISFDLKKMIDILTFTIIVEINNVLIYFFLDTQLLLNETYNPENIDNETLIVFQERGCSKHKSFKKISLKCKFFV